MSSSGLTLLSGRSYYPENISVAKSKKMDAMVQRIKDELMALNGHWRGPPTLAPPLPHGRGYALVGVYLSIRQIVCKQLPLTDSMVSVERYFLCKIQKFGYDVRDLGIWPRFSDSDDLFTYLKRWCPQKMVSSSEGPKALYPIAFGLKYLEDVSPTDDDSSDDEPLPEPPTKRFRNDTQSS